MEKIYIIGMGIISSIGMNVKENLQSLQNGKTGIGKIKHLDSVHKDNFVAAEIDLTIDELLKSLNYKNTEDKIHIRSTLFSIIAAKEAMKKANITSNEGIKTALISANTLGGMWLSENNYKDYKTVNPKIFNEFTFTNEGAETIANELGDIDFISTINTACSSSANSIIYGAQMLKTGRAQRVIVGGTDSLAKFSFNGFNSLKILSEKQCKPFDENRNGLNLGEAAAYLILETESTVKKYNHKPIAELSGYYNANDAYHQTASSPEGQGAKKAMSEAIKSANLNTDDISCIHTHGTATSNNDITESMAMKSLFEKVPPFYSSKSYVGHTLGAAGALNAVYSIFSLQNNQIYSTLNVDKPILEFNFKTKTKLLNNYKVNHVLSNAFGFGGNNTSLVFSKVKMEEK